MWLNGYVAQSTSFMECSPHVLPEKENRPLLLNRIPLIVECRLNLTQRNPIRIEPNEDPLRLWIDVDALDSA